MKINPELLPETTVTTTSDGWLRVEDDICIKWHKRGTDRRQMTGASWGAYQVSTKPADLTADDKTFFYGGAFCGDGAMVCELAPNDNWGINLTRYWHYDSTVTLSVNWFANIIQYK